MSKPAKWFGLKAVGSKTEIRITEYDDGLMGISLCTARDGIDPIITSMHLTSETFSALSDALNRVHDPSVWKKPIPKKVDMS